MFMLDSRGFETKFERDLAEQINHDTMYLKAMGTSLALCVDLALRSLSNTMSY